MPTSLDALKAAIAGGKALLVCGAGVSRAVAGDAAKGWKGLIESAIDAAPNESGQDWRAACKAILSSTDSETWLSAADIAQKKLGGRKAGKYRAWLMKSVGELMATKPALLDAIKVLPCRLATTNYDGLLRAHMGVEAKTWLNPNAVAEILKGKTRNVWHIHGYWDEPESVIFSNADYERVSRSDQSQFLQHHAAFADTLFFIGCSADGLADQNVGKLLNWFGDVWGGLGENHFALVTDGEMSARGWPTAVTECRTGQSTMPCPLSCAALPPTRRKHPTASTALSSLLANRPPSDD
jgi:hypothetical protein